MSSFTFAYRGSSRTSLPWLRALLLLLTHVATTGPIAAQSARQPSVSGDRQKHSNQFSLLGGLTQVAAGGGNVEATWYTDRLSFDYSHGVSLEFTGGLIDKTAREQKLAIQVPWTTGFGVGYRFTSALDIRIEPKWHRYKVFYESQNFSGTAVREYTTSTLGLGAYYRLYPFARARNWSRGVVIAPSVRYWPNIWTSLPGGKFSYASRATGRQETLKAATQGLPGTTGLFANVSLGYTF